jgi:TP901 family phage tail tape measure protein
MHDVVPGAGCIVVGANTGGSNMPGVEQFQILINATQAKQELARLTAANKIMASSIQASWTAVNMALKGAVIGFLAVAGATAASFMAINEFNKNLVHTAALGDLTDQEMAKLGNQITDLGKKYGLSSTIIAEGTVILAKAGLTMDQTVAAMEPISQLMMANAISFETAAEIGVMSVNAFGKSYEDLTDLFDISQHVAQQTLLDIEDLQQGLQYAASTAALTGVAFEELVTMMGVLSQNAMVAGVASRSMNRMMLSMVENADEVQRWADSMGLGVEIIKEGVLNISEIIPAFAEMEQNVEFLQQSMEYFSIRGMRSWAILVQHAGDYVRLLEEARGASGVLAATAERQATSLSYVWGRIREELLTPFRTEEIRQSLTGVMNQFSKSMENVGDSLSHMVKILVEEFGRLAPKIGPMIESIVSTLSRFMVLMRWGAELITGFNGPLIFMLLLFRRLRNSKILMFFQNYKLTMAESTTNMTILNSELAMYNSQLTLAKGTVNELVVAEQLKIATARKDLEMMKLRQVRMNMYISSLMMAGMGIMMIIMGNTKWMKIMGIIIVTLAAVTIAYNRMAMAALIAGEAMMPGSGLLRVAGWGLVAAGGSAAIAAATWKNTEIKPESLQRGTSVITKPTLAMLHAGEAVSSANKPLDMGGITINVQGDLVDHEAFFERLEKEVAVRMGRSARRYI